MKLIIRFMFEVLVLIFLIWIIDMFSIFVHEIGHAIGYIIAKKIIIGMYELEREELYVK
ncbi:hypothetical protein [Clostridium novyi]